MKSSANRANELIRMVEKEWTARLSDVFQLTDVLLFEAKEFSDI